MRIVLSNASAKWGGVHVVTELLARGLQARGHDVVLFCRPRSALHERLRDVVTSEPFLRGMDLHPLALSRCWRALRRHRPDVVLTLMDKDVRLTAPVARLLGVPVVVRRANDRPWKRNLYVRWLYGRIPEHHIANSQATRRSILASAPWLDPARVSVIYNGVEITRFERVSPADLGLPAGAVVIGFLGRLEVRKGLLDLIAAWPAVAAAIPHAHLVIAGKGELEAEARARTKELPRVRWLGFRNDVAPYLKALDMLAMPSHWEGFGMAAVEALAAGVPVIAARASSLPEIVEDGVHGQLVPARDPAALARALVELAGDASARRRMGSAGRERVRREFSLPRMLDGYESVLRALTDPVPATTGAQGAGR